MNKKDGRLPAFKRKLSSFLSKEDGKISKKSLLKAGITAAMISIVATEVTATACDSAQGGHSSIHANQCELLVPLAENNDEYTQHSNSLNLIVNSGTAVGEHAHCAGLSSHCSHASHGSHNSHGSHSSWGGY